MIYTAGRVELLRGNTGDVQAASKFKCVLVQPDSSYLDEHPATMSAFTTLSALTASSEKVLTGVAVTTLLTRVLMGATNPAWTGLTPDEIVAGIVIYRFVTNFGASIPYYGIPLGQPATIPGDGTYTFPFNTDGIVEL